MQSFSEDEDDEDDEETEDWEYIEVPERAIAFPEDLPWGGDQFRHIIFCLLLRRHSSKGGHCLL